MVGAKKIAIVENVLIIEILIAIVIYNKIPIDYFRSPLESDENEIWDILSSASASSLEDIKVTYHEKEIDIPSFLPG